MDEHWGNPAGRLFMFLEMTTRYPDHSAPLRKVWSEYLGIGQDSTAEYISAMVSVLKLPDEIELAVGELDSAPLPRMILLRPVSLVREELATALMGANPVSWAKSVFDSGVRNDLEACSHILKANARLRSPDDDQLTIIRSLVEEVIDEVARDGGLDLESREALLRYAYTLQRALDLYRVSGPQALVDELDRFWGASRRLETSPAPGVLDRLKQLTGAIVVAVGLFTGPVDVSSAITAYAEMWALPSSVEAPAAGVDLPLS